MKFNDDELGQLTLTLQRKEGKTPGELMAEAEQERDQLQAKLVNLVSAVHGFLESEDLDDVEDRAAVFSSLNDALLAAGT